ncbi:aldolase [Coprinopsis marcescibilis]|uniref:Transaldolase n=1 Tax=Coprinopsis marcescibilis TaxID=230819 RepID=A0A5C3KZS4_COPMA|nr:aldolase [Coprinopsis marcescibilis]
MCAAPESRLPPTVRSTSGSQSFFLWTRHPTPPSYTSPSASQNTRTSSTKPSNTPSHNRRNSTKMNGQRWRCSSWYAPLATPTRIPLTLVPQLVLVGVQILSIIPGRVSASVDPRVGSSIPATLKQARTIISLFEEHSIPRSRVLIKVPGTPEGITAAHILEHPTDGSEPIHTNITLIFGRAQALACAQAGLSVISPFVGRVKDWWDAQGQEQPGTAHPGLVLVSSVQRGFAHYGYKGRTEVMAAGFRKPEEVLVMAAGLGRPDEVGEVTLDSKKGWKRGTFEAADLVTVPPELLEGLRSWVFSTKATSTKPRSREVEVDEDTEPIYFVRPSTYSDDASPSTTSLYDSALRSTDRIVLDKVAEGLSKFSADAEKLEGLVRKKLLFALSR